MKFSLTCLLLAFAAFASAAPIQGDLIAPFQIRKFDSGSFAWKPGRTTVLSFCAFWCDTWKVQLPRVQAAMKATEGLPVDFVTISVDGRWTDKAKSAAVGTMLSDAGGSWSHSLAVDRVPYTLVIDKNGRVAWTSFGTVYSEDLIRSVRDCVQGSSVEGGVVYLTFDDFPAEKLSEELLDLLRAEGVKATFFCIGDKVEGSASLLKRAVREGHEVGIHSWSHDGNNPQLAKCSAALLSVTGKRAVYYRPPGSEKVLTLNGKSLSLPVDDPYDYTRPGVDELTRRVLMLVRPNAVIQLHAGVQDTLDALPGIIKNLKERGYDFELLKAL